MGLRPSIKQSVRNYLHTSHVVKHSDRISRGQSF